MQAEQAVGPHLRRLVPGLVRSCIRALRLGICSPREFKVGSGLAHSPSRFMTLGKCNAVPTTEHRRNTAATNEIRQTMFSGTRSRVTLHVSALRWWSAGDDDQCQEPLAAVSSSLAGAGVIIDRIVVCEHRGRIRWLACCDELIGIRYSKTQETYPTDLQRQYDMLRALCRQCAQESMGEGGVRVSTSTSQDFYLSSQ